MLLTIKKNLCLLAITILTIISATAQPPVSWRFTSKKTADKTFEIHLTATVSSPWHLYSQTTPEGGPLPTQISFIKNPLILIEGNTIELGKLETKHEDVFGIDVKYFNNTVDFVQIVKLKSKIKTNLSGSVTYMVCNDQQCLPPATTSFSIKLQ